MTGRNGTPYHTIFFDVGGALLTADPSMGAVYAEVAARFGVHVDADEIEKAVRREFRRHRELELAARSRHTLSLEKAKRWWRDVVRASFAEAAESPRFEACFTALFDEFALPRRYRLYPEVHEVIGRLQQNGSRLGLLSNWDARLRPVLEAMGVDAHFDPIVISSEVGTEKPDRRIYDIARERAGARREDRLLMIGDNARDDVEGAKAAGFEARLLRRHEGQTLQTVLDGVMD